MNHDNQEALDKAVDYLNNNKINDKQLFIDTATKLRYLLDAMPSTRETSLAKTKLEECIMWATKETI